MNLDHCFKKDVVDETIVSPQAFYQPEKYQNAFKSQLQIENQINKDLVENGKEFKTLMAEKKLCLL